MCNFKPEFSFDKIHRDWLKCFKYIFHYWHIGYTDKIIESLFYDFEMANWTALHQENTEYKGFSKRKLIASFCSECCYISDRTSYDRVFRTHWLFRKAFHKELLKLI